MKWMHELVIPEVCYCWKTIADFLEYPLAKKEIEEKQRDDPRKCCVELMENWLNSDWGVTLKSWCNLLSVLKQITDLSNTAHSTEQHLLKEGFFCNDK